MEKDLNAPMGEDNRPKEPSRFVRSHGYGSCDRATRAGAVELKFPSLVAFIGGAEQTVLAIKNFPTAHQAELHATKSNQAPP
jgi:hypothetical protein